MSKDFIPVIRCDNPECCSESDADIYYLEGGGRRDNGRVARLRGPRWVGNRGGP